MHDTDPSIDVFNQDIAAAGGYLYINDDRLSTRFAMRSRKRVLLEFDRFEGRSVLDLGCGDGTFTRFFWDRTHPRAMVGIDAAAAAVGRANEQRGGRPIHFEVGDAHHVPFPDDSFDVVLLQAMLHHDNKPFDTIREAFRLAPEIIVLEPNGYNLGVKVIERTSLYHRAHGERSYLPRRIDRWVTDAGGTVVTRRFVGFVPVFCPDWMARTLRVVEPVVERVPLLRDVGCALYVFVATRDT